MVGHVERGRLGYGLKFFLDLLLDRGRALRAWVFAWTALVCALIASVNLPIAAVRAVVVTSMGFSLSRFGGGLPGKLRLRDEAEQAGWGCGSDQNKLKGRKPVNQICRIPRPICYNDTLSAEACKCEP